MSSTRNLILAVAAATLSTLSFAQAPAASVPPDVGVSPRTANEAMKQAVPREDTATVTSTGESPPVNQGSESDREAAGNAADRTSDAARADTSVTTSTTTTVETDQRARTPRADRH
ncbi:hypothetical protein [Caldimonas tepidiphila]|uniref:hypothetical protein n=1 Tax=Caldimonas tepidiphila TaxID=2315841 RepID=UPI00130072FF|nr:hypothetical protein [Caldimonas tepidiphila]